MGEAGKLMPRIRKVGYSTMKSGNSPGRLAAGRGFTMPVLRAGFAFMASALWVVSSAQEIPLEEIVVTGTRIARPDFVSASPIVTVPTEAFAQIGSSTAETTLNRMPQFVPAATGTSNGIADGQAQLDLRGLGAGRTLVLVDGRRRILLTARACRT